MKRSTKKEVEETKERSTPKAIHCGKKRSRASKLEELTQGVEPSTIRFEADPQFTKQWYELLTFEVSDAGKQGAYTIPKDLDDE